VEAVCLVALVLACVRLGRGLEAVLDLGLWDEADYLYRAFMLPVRGLPDPEWGPLYSLWYFALSRVWEEPVELFHANARLLLLLTTVAGYAFLRHAGARPWLALAGASVYLLSGAPHVLPRPTVLAALVILAALIAAARVRSPERACALAGVGLLTASFARPEAFLSFLLMSALLGVLLARGVWRERARWPSALGLAATYGGVVLALVAVMGNPFGNTSNRRFYAFCQHFADNYVRRTGFPVNPWGACDKAVAAAFGPVTTLGAAARSNPGELLLHLRANVARYPRESLRMFASGYGGLSPLPGRGQGVGHLLLLAVAVGLPAAVLARRWRRLGTALRQPAVTRLLVATACVLLPVVASVVLIQPRQHYLVLQGLLVLAVLAALRASVEPAAAPGPGGWVPPVALAGVLLLSVPDLVQRQGGPGAVRRPQLDRLRAIHSLGLEARVGPGDSIGVLDAQGGLAVYLGAPYRRVPDWTKRARESFTAYLRRERIDLVLLDGMLRKHPRFAGDPEFEAFFSAPGAFGYATWRLPGTDAVLAFPDAWVSGETPRTALSRPEPVPAVPRCSESLPAAESGGAAQAAPRPGCARLPSSHL